jgi:hypothetical protein
MTRDRASSFTKASTQTRLPSGNAISMAPARRSTLRCDPGDANDASIAGVSFADPPITPTGKNLIAPEQPAPVCNTAFLAERQL